MNRLFFCFALLFVHLAFGKVRILTFHYNQANFIELQRRCLQRFLRDDYELLVFNDAATVENEKAIQNACDRLGIQCIRFEPEWHLMAPLNEYLLRCLTDPSLQDAAFLSMPFEKFANQASVRHSHVIQYALDHYGYDHDDAVVIMDGDAFFIRDISVKERLKSLDIFGMTREIKEKNVQYLWVPFIAFNPAKLPNIRDLKFNVAVIHNKVHDTGAQSYYYLADNPTVKCRKILPVPSNRLRRLSEKELKQAGYNRKERWLIDNLPKNGVVEFNLENCVLHFREVSFEIKGHRGKAEVVAEFMEKILKR